MTSLNSFAALSDLGESIEVVEPVSRYSQISKSMPAFQPSSILLMITLAIATIICEVSRLAIVVS